MMEEWKRTKCAEVFKKKKVCGREEKYRTTVQTKFGCMKQFAQNKFRKQESMTKIQFISN